MAPVFEKDGKLEFEFAKKATVIDLNNVQEAMRLLVRMIVTLDLRLQSLEK